MHEHLVLVGVDRADKDVLRVRRVRRAEREVGRLELLAETAPGNKGRPQGT